MAAPRLIFIAGPNGAGKSTFHEAFLRSSGLPFVNADRFAAALGIPNREAADAADAARAQFIAEGQSFITETVFSDPAGAKLQLLREAIAAKYRVTFYYIGIASVELSEARVFQRVRGGGHDVPSERLARRFRQSIINLSEAVKFVPEINVFDNSSSEVPYRLVLSMRWGRVEFVSKAPPIWLAPAISALPK